MPTIIGANTASGAYEIENSIRLKGTDTYLKKTVGNGNRRKWTLSMWLKKTKIINNTEMYLWSSDDTGAGNAHDGAGFYSFGSVTGDNESNSFHHQLGDAHGRIVASSHARDTSGWYHMVWNVDTANSTAGDRMQLYVNGSRITDVVTSNNNPDQNFDTEFNRNNTENYLFADHHYTRYYFDGYVADVAFVDGQAYDASYFGETNTNGVWVPIQPNVSSWGTNGFFLEFKQTGTSANASGIGADTSGNDNHWTPVNLAAADIVTDTPTNNFATLNPMAGNSQLVANGYFFGNTRVNSNVVGVGNSNYLMSMSSIGVTSGKWYAEFKPTGNLYSSGTNSSSLIGVGSGIYEAGDGNHNTAIGGFTHWWLDHDDDRVVVDGSIGNTNMNSSTHVQANDIIGVYLNCDTTMPTVTFHKNGAALGGATNSPYNVRRTGSYNLGTNSPIFFMPVVRYGDGSNWGRFECNFGNPPSLPSSGNTDANGYGNFEYSPTLGGVEYYALCTKNLAEYG